MRPPKDYKNSVIKNLEADLQEYLSDHPDATVQDIREHFGAPEAYARELDVTTAPGEKEQRRTFRRRILIAVIAAVAAMVLIWAAGVICAVSEANSHTNSYSIYEIS